LPQKERKSVEQLVRNAEVNTLISKMITTIFMTIFGAAVFGPLVFGASSGLPKELVLAGGISAFLAVVLSLITIMGLQVTTSLVSSKVAELLSPLPLSKGDASKIIFFCLVRIFDIPLVGAMVILLSAYFLAGGSLVGSVVVFAGISVTELFALASTIVLARFFYTRVASGGGRSRWNAFLRLVFMLVWILPSFGTYLLVNFSTEVVQSFASTTQVVSSSMQYLLLVYPFSFGFLASFATFGGFNYVALSFSLISSITYVGLAVFSLKWVLRYVGSMGIGGYVTVARETVKDTLIKPKVPWLGIVRKDLRVASRSPSYASLFLLPPIQAGVLALSFSSFGEVGLASALGILTGISLVTLVLPPTLLSIEGLASVYTRSFPIRRNTVISAKAALSLSTYFLSLTILLTVTALMQRDFSLILVFGVVHMLSIAAAVLLELLLLANRFWKEGFAVGNIYARLSTYILVLVPGFVVALIPIGAAILTYFIVENLTLIVFFGVAVLELSLMILAITCRK